MNIDQLKAVSAVLSALEGDIAALYHTLSFTSCRFCDSTGGLSHTYYVKDEIFRSLRNAHFDRVMLLAEKRIKCLESAGIDCSVHLGTLNDIRSQYEQILVGGDDR